MVERELWVALLMEMMSSIDERSKNCQCPEYVLLLPSVRRKTLEEERTL
jgi:hypothetical protein